MASRDLQTHVTECHRSLACLLESGRCWTDLLRKASLPRIYTTHLAIPTKSPWSAARADADVKEDPADTQAKKVLQSATVAWPTWLASGIWATAGTSICCWPPSVLPRLPVEAAVEARLSNSCPGGAVPGYKACGGQVSSDGCSGFSMKGLGPKLCGGSPRLGWQS